MSHTQVIAPPADQRAHAMRRATEALTAIVAARGRALALPDVPRAEAMAKLGSALELLTQASQSIEAGIVGPDVRRRISVARLLARIVDHAVGQCAC